MTDRIDIAALKERVDMTEGRCATTFKVSEARALIAVAEGCVVGSAGFKRCLLCNGTGTEGHPIRHQVTSYTGLPCPVAALDLGEGG